MDNLTTDWKRQIGTVRLCSYKLRTPSVLRWLKTSAFAQAKTLL